MSSQICVIAESVSLPIAVNWLVDICCFDESPSSIICNLPPLAPEALPKGADRLARGLASPCNMCLVGLSKDENWEDEAPVGCGWVKAASYARRIVYNVELRSFVAWFKASLDGRDRLFLPTLSVVQSRFRPYGAWVETPSPKFSHDGTSVSREYNSTVVIPRLASLGLIELTCNGIIQNKAEAILL